MPTPQVPVGGTGYSVVPSSSMARTAGYVSQERKLVIASNWFFKPDGVALVRQRLMEAFDPNYLTKFDWDSREFVFRVGYIPSPAGSPWQTLTKIIRDIINKDGDQQRSPEAEDDDDENLEELGSDEGEEEPSGNRYIVAISELDEHDLVEAGPPMLQDLSELNDAELVSAIVKNRPFKTSWTCLDIFLQVVSVENLEEIVRLLPSVQMFKNVEKMRLYIGSNCEEDCDKVVSKLDVIAKFVKTSDYTMIGHVFYSEDVDNFQVALKPFAEIKKKYFETTLIDSLKMPASNIGDVLTDAVTARCAYYDLDKNLYVPVKELKYQRATEDAEKSLPFRDFASYRYSSLGSIEPMQLVDNQQQSRGGEQSQYLLNQIPISELAPEIVIQDGPDLAEKINNWVDEISSIGPLIGESFPALIEKPPMNNWDHYKEFKEQIKEHATEIIVNQYGWSADLQATQRPNLATSSQVPPHSATHMSQSEIETSRAVSHLEVQSGKKYQVSRLQIDRPGEKPLRPENMPQGLHYQSISTHDQTHNQAIPSEPGLDYNRSGTSRVLNGVDSLLDDEYSTIDSFPVLTPMRAASDEPDNSIRSYYDVLIRPEAVQDVDEVSTRQFFQTMNQKAPKSSNGKQSIRAGEFSNRLPMPNTAGQDTQSAAPPKADDPIPRFMNSTTSNFKTLVHNVRGFRGEILIEVAFGRILMSKIQRRFLDKKDAHHSHGPEAVEELLFKARAKPHFSKVLTTIPTDVHHIIDLELDGQRMWTTKPYKWDVKYEFLFCKKHPTVYKPFIIEVDGERNTMTVKIESSLGSIFVHGLRRRWDFQIYARGFQGGNTEKMYDLGNAIKASLFVPPSLSQPFLHFKLESKLADTVQIEGVRVKRTCQYSGINSPTALKVTEVQDLSIEVRRDGSTEAQIFRAHNNPTNQEPTVKPDMWYEVTITCPELEGVLETNKNLELGDEPGWTAESLSESEFGKQICLRACQVLKQLDGVGYYNDNHADLPSKRQAAPPSVRGSVGRLTAQSDEPEYW